MRSRSWYFLFITTGLVIVTVLLNPPIVALGVGSGVVTLHVQLSGNEPLEGEWSIATGEWWLPPSVGGEPHRQIVTVKDGRATLRTEQTKSFRNWTSWGRRRGEWIMPPPELVLVHNGKLFAQVAPLDVLTREQMLNRDVFWYDIKLDKAGSAWSLGTVRARAETSGDE